MARSNGKLFPKPLPNIAPSTQY
ncbi:hypothetical protein CCACVL1_12380 [Corchorus capsularis]|uniref:Uncharacterized protein n=1 Tax=Corchorus capsularis TaxID=210143 RepID=A0A1R3IG05_COCAP|nr:hypothetical protein CCACVL1_12380 [Corchorus capsularis]